MTLTDAYAALHDKLTRALEASGFLGDTTLGADPVAPMEADGLDGSVQTVAALYEINTPEPVRVLMGGPAPRYVVERNCRLELAAFGGDADERSTRLASGLVAAASVVAGDADLTLGGTCERLDFGGVEPDDMPPDGMAQLITYRLRVRSGDPLGMTP